MLSRKDSNVEQWLSTGDHQLSDPAHLRDVYQLTDEALALIKQFEPLAREQMSTIVDRWYAWLHEQPEFGQFFSDEETVDRVKGLQFKYWESFFSGVVDDDYIGHRNVVGSTHARIGLSLNTYFGGMSRFMTLFEETMSASDMDPATQIATASAVSRLLHADTAIVVSTYTRIVEDTLTAQGKSLLEMSTPVTQIWSDILLLPIVGIIDSARANDIMNASLAKIGETQARIFILDISGVGVVDTAVANHLIKITRATRLMGCECTISGLSPAIAQTIVDLGIDVGRTKTTANMKDALAHAFHRVGLQVTPAVS
jgi:rsbT co-antagonist protein RsbR